nr:olfactory receptor 2G3 [Oryctolagus cuniculus]
MQDFLNSLPQDAAHFFILRAINLFSESVLAHFWIRLGIPTFISFDSQSPENSNVGSAHGFQRGVSDVSSESASGAGPAASVVLSALALCHSRMKDAKHTCSVPLLAGATSFGGMGWANESALVGFILLGFSDHPHLEAVLFVFVLFFYLLTLVGNFTIIVVSYLDPPLHTPMYFFLGNLSVLDLCFTSSLAPQTLVNLRGPEKTITHSGCVVQLYVSLALGSTECVLLAVMALDRYIAICRPLHYVVIMSPRICWQLACASWLSGLANALVHATLALQLPLCGSHRLDHFICEVPALLKLACVDTTINELVLLGVSVLFLVLPPAFILISYGFVTQAVLRIRSVEARHKAFSTCSSHLAVVVIFYGTIIYMYLQPSHSYAQDQGKFISLFYTMVTPTLNPIIYTLRNKDIKEALKRLFSGQLCTTWRWCSRHWL